MKQSYTSVSGSYGNGLIPLGILDIPEEGRGFVRAKILDSFGGHLEDESRKGKSYEMGIGRNGDWESLGFFSPDLDLPDGVSMDEYIRGYSENVIGFTLGPIFLKGEPETEDVYRVFLRKI
jgi:hypothetical protein